MIGDHHRSMQMAGYEIPDVAAVYADAELPRRKEIYRAAKQARLEVADRKARDRAAGEKDEAKAVDTRLPKAIAKGLIEGEKPDRIIAELTRQGLPEKLVSDAVRVADSHLYVEVAREVVAEMRTLLAKQQSVIDRKATNEIESNEANVDTATESDTEPAAISQCPAAKIGFIATAATVDTSSDSSDQDDPSSAVTAVAKCGDEEPQQSTNQQADAKGNAFVAYEIYPVKDMPLIPAPINREWMDNTQKRFAYRCLPLTLANQAGWLVGCPTNFSARWNGGPRVEDVTLIFDEGVKETRISSLFGHGTFTFNMPYLFRTPKDVNLWVKGPTNAPKDGVFPLEGLVETDWTNASFTMNWKLTRPGQLVRFEIGDPICMVVPFPRGFLDALDPVRRSLESDPETQAKYLKWSHDRSQFQEKVADGDETAVKRGWQKDYFQGRDPGAEKFDGHQTKLGLDPFRPGMP